MARKRVTVPLALLLLAALAGGAGYFLYLTQPPAAPVPPATLAPRLTTHQVALPVDLFGSPMGDAACAG